MTILDTREGICYWCGRARKTEVHHVFNASDRNASEKYGLTVNLCRECHDRLHFGHKDDDVKIDKSLKKKVQETAMAYYGWSMEDWLGKFRRNYI